MLYHIAIGKNDYCKIIINRAFQLGSGSKESACTARDVGSIPGSGGFPEGGDGNPFQYSCLENPMDRGDNPWNHIELVMTEQLMLSLSLSEPTFYFEPEFTKRDIFKKS